MQKPKYVQRKMYTKTEVKKLVNEALDFFRSDQSGYPGLKKSWQNLKDSWINKNINQ